MLQTLPLDFNVKQYRELNPDIAEQNNKWLERHYLKHGYNEGRIYKITVPESFDVEIYKECNPDLQHLSNIELAKHFFLHGETEKRLYKDELFDKEYFIASNNILKYEGYKTYLKDIRSFKSKTVEFFIKNFPIIECDIILVNHNNSINGATHSLYDLYDFLKSKNKKVIVLEISKNEKFFEKYNIEEKDIIYYHGDATILYWLCKKIISQKIIFNSINFAISQAIKWLDRKKFLLFSREIKEHYMKRSSLMPDFVLTPQIANSYSNKPFIQTPILSSRAQKQIEQQLEIQVNIPGLDTNKITLGMCGVMGERKNIKLFIELARILTKYNFVWIGGTENIQSKPSNLFHIKDVTYPYSYFNLLDYFVLFSADEPFGKVVIENLFIGNRVLTFKDNIYYRHESPLLKDLYFEFKGPITKLNAIRHITTICNQKNSRTQEQITNGKQYVKENFTNYNKQLIEKLKL